MNNHRRHAMTDRLALFASEAPPRSKRTNYPAPFAARVAGRDKRPLGDLFGLRNFGVNLTRLAPGAASSLHHRHSRQDEFIYVLEGKRRCSPIGVRQRSGPAWWRASRRTEPRITWRITATGIASSSRSAIAAKTIGSATRLM